ncbi:MAG: SH3 domain-containing protein [Pyramidobacter sp.]
MRNPTESKKAFRRLASAVKNALAEAKKRISQSPLTAEAQKNAHFALIHSLRTVGSLCAAGADRLERGGSIASLSPAAEPESLSKPTVSRFSSQRPLFGRSARSSRHFVRTPNSIHRSRHSFSPAVWILALALAGGLAGGAFYYFSGRTATLPDGSDAVIAKLKQSDPDAQQKMPLPAETAAHVQLTRDGVNLRDGHATTGTKVLARLDAERAPLLERWQDAPSGQIWFKVQSSKGPGWVSAQNAVELPPAGQKSGTVQGRLKGTGINVRDGHSTQNTRVLMQMSNQPVTVLERWQGKGEAFPWYRIQLEQGDGWVYGRYVQVP